MVKTLSLKIQIVNSLLIESLEYIHFVSGISLLDSKASTEMFVGEVHVEPFKLSKNKLCPKQVREAIRINSVKKVYFIVRFEILQLTYVHVH